MEGLWLNQTVADGVTDKSGSAADAQLVHDAGPVRFDGLGTDAEQARDPLCRFAFHGKLKDLALAGA